jgi:hypothetical protein
MPGTHVAASERAEQYQHQQLDGCGRYQKSVEAQGMRQRCSTAVAVLVELCVQEVLQFEKGIYARKACGGCHAGLPARFSWAPSAAQLQLRLVT